MGQKRGASEASDDSLVAKKLKKDPSTSGPSSSSSSKKDADGNDYWELTDKRRVTVSQFKSQHLISVREYYEQNGEMKPGKKGISLTVAQFSALVEALPAIEASLKAAGQAVSRPRYNQVAGDGLAGDEDEDEEVPDADADADAEEGKGDGKKNFEETSEEED